MINLDPEHVRAEARKIDAIYEANVRWKDAVLDIFRRNLRLDVRKRMIDKINLDAEAEIARLENS